ncbi:amidohydrolase [Streptosporangium fragile]|uniref:Amidohydrolase n=1 Tax=Streptosporangium fragile TaxID=46186 RepID=A0ABP6IK46_9ACTN
MTFTGGTIWGGAAVGDLPRLLVDGGVVVETGPGGAGVPETGHETEVVDLDGGFLMPAFGDGHAHPVLAGLEGLGPRIRACRSVREIQDAVRAWADGNPETPWILGGSYDATLTPDGMFDARWLDEAVDDRPVVLRAWDYHTVWCNSAALAKAGIDADTPDPPGGRIARRPDGSPLGTLIEWDAVDLVAAVAAPWSRAQKVEALRRATGELARHGITWVQDAWVDPDDVETYLAAAAADALAIRADLAFRADPHRWAGQRGELSATRDLLERAAPGRLTARTVKFFVDGIIENRTAHLLDPYSDHRCTRGMPVWGDQALREAAAEADRQGFALHLHAIGDAGVRSALDAIEHVERVNGPRDRRPVVAHAQLVSPDDLDRFAALGVVACFQPLWARRDAVMRKLTIPRIGPERGGAQYRIGSVLRSGARVSFGSDWPVTSPDVLAGIATAVTRQDGDGEPAGGWLPGERIDVVSALSAATAGVAYQAFAEGRRGTLVPGADADLVWLSADPRATPPERLHEIRVRGTWLAGHRVH